jgi:hypothetical protein
MGLPSWEELKGGIASNFSPTIKELLVIGGEKIEGGRKKRKAQPRQIVQCRVSFVTAPAPAPATSVHQVHHLTILTDSHAI